MSADRVARATLTAMAEPGDRRIGRLLLTHDAQELVAGVRAGSGLIEGEDRYAARLATVDPLADLARLEQVGGRLVIPGDLEWPRQLDDLGDAAPWALWVRGTVDLRLTALRAVAVVGARAATTYGKHVASVFASDLAASGWAVVSGGAYGIDAEAHQGALAAGGVTVAVLACGVDVAYPARHDALFARIAADGLLVSEVPPGSAPHRGRFLIRNRVIAALTRGTVVIEAALRSGSLSTASHADRLGRPVLAVPGPVTSQMSQGVHREIRRGALLVTSAAEIIEAVGGLGVDLAPEARGRADPRDELDLICARALDALPAHGSLTLESVARAAGLTQAETAAALGLLELSGFVRGGIQGWAITRGDGAPR